MRRVFLVLVFCGGCGGYYDTYRPPEKAMEENPPVKVFFPQVHFAGRMLPGFTVVAGNRRFVSTFDMRRGLLVLVMGERPVVRELARWVKEIRERYAGRYRLLVVINLGYEHWFRKYVMRAFLRRSVLAQYASVAEDLPPPIIDWSARAAEALSLCAHGPYVLVARDGRILITLSGAPSPGRSRELRRVLDAELTVVRDAPLPEGPHLVIPRAGRQGALPSGTPAKPAQPPPRAVQEEVIEEILRSLE